MRVERVAAGVVVNSIYTETGPDGGAIPMTLTIEDGDGDTRQFTTRGLLAYKNPVDSLAASEWNAWIETPALAEDERISRVTATDAARGISHLFTALFSERLAGPLFGPSFYDSLRIQLTPRADDVQLMDFDTGDFSGADFA